jgi:hypothetical protein
VFSSHLRFLSLAICLTLIACGGSKEEPKVAPKAKVEKKERAATKAEEAKKPAQEADTEDKEARKARTAVAFKASYCASSKGDLDGAEKAYTDNGFKGRSQFLKTWKFYAERDEAWASAIAGALAKKPCN